MTNEQRQQIIEEWERDGNTPLPEPTNRDLLDLCRRVEEAVREEIAVSTNAREQDLRQHATVIGSTQWGTQAAILNRADELRVLAAAIRSKT